MSEKMGRHRALRGAALQLWVALVLLTVGCTEVSLAEGVHSLEGAHPVMAGDDPAYARADFDDASWPRTPTPGGWQDERLTYGNVGWYRIHVPASAVEASAGDLALYLGAVAGAFEVFFNGERLGGVGRFPPDVSEHHGATGVLRIPRSRVRGGGRDVIAVRMLDTWVGGLAWGPLVLGDPIGVSAIRSRDVMTESVYCVALASMTSVVALLILILGSLAGSRLSSSMLALTMLFVAFWKVYESPFAADAGLGASGVFGFYLGSGLLASATFSIFIQSYFERPSRRALVLFTAAALAGCACCAIAPVWVLQSGLYQVFEVLCVLTPLGVAVSVLRRHRRRGVSWFIGVTIGLAVLAVLVDVSSGWWDVPSSVTRYGLDFVYSALLLTTAVVAMVASAQRDRRLRELPAELRAVSVEARQSVGRELHDGVVQELHAVRAQLDRLEHGSGADAASQLDEVVNELRHVAHGLHSGAELALQPRLERYVARLDRSSASRVELEIEPAAALGWSPEAAHHLFRIVQEAVGNALAHADAERVSVSLREASAHRVLDVLDDGVGMRGAPSDGMGMESMRRRAVALSAELSFEAAQPGTLVRLEVPWST